MNSLPSVTVGLVQIGNSFSGQYYLPYSVGMLQAYALAHVERVDRFRFLTPIYRRILVTAFVDQLGAADIVFFSTYIWNEQLSLAAARAIKQHRPDALIVFGGPQVPADAAQLEDFLRRHPWIDLAGHGEGERTFAAILERMEDRRWQDVPGVGYVAADGRFVRTASAPRITDLNEIPSPYLEGLFDGLLELPVQWQAMWETNRGCPFSCSFCAWGSPTDKKISQYAFDRLKEEVDWFSAHKIEFVFCCDANFGALKRDQEIVEYVAANKRRTGYPKAFSVQNTKNSTTKILNVQKTLSEAGLQKGVNLALQSVNEPTLASIKRSNIRSSVYVELEREFAALGVPTFSDIIIGLPEESYETFTEGVASIVRRGQYNNIQFINLTILPNTDLADPDYVAKYGLVTSRCPIIYHHGSIEDEEVPEYQEIVVGSRTMSTDDWIRARTFAWLASLLFFDKVFQVPLVLAQVVSGATLRELVGYFVDPPEDCPTLRRFAAQVRSHAQGITQGGPEHVASKGWLGIWRPVDEYLLIELVARGELERFYAEATGLLLSRLEASLPPVGRSAIRDAARLNMALLKVPCAVGDVCVDTSVDVYGIYRKMIAGARPEVEYGSASYTIHRSAVVWTDFDEWLREVVWYAKKRGAYCYSCTPADGQE